MATVVGKLRSINIATTPYFTTTHKSTRSITTQSKTHNSAQFQATQLTRNQAHLPAPLARYPVESALYLIIGKANVVKIIPQHIRDDTRSPNPKANDNRIQRGEKPTLQVVNKGIGNKTEPSAETSNHTLLRGRQRGILAVEEGDGHADAITTGSAFDHESGNVAGCALIEEISAGAGAAVANPAVVKEGFYLGEETLGLLQDVRAQLGLVRRVDVVGYFLVGGVFGQGAVEEDVVADCLGYA
ncbi:MAG: hypothetical protein ASARMPREDX12_006950 [Alectoria sarmentosa]|nr:MAG: hypothetical protein ASARMPREDX12_006950 [Alectoria sarmentosa]